MNIIVTGSLGNIGQPLTEVLVQKGHRVTVISHSQERQPAIEALGATAAIGALQDADFLTVTFTGADAVYCMVPPNFGAPDNRVYYREIAHSYADAIRQSGVKRVVHLSSWGADKDHGTGFILGSHDAEGILNELPDITLTHLRAGSFYTNLFGFIGMIKGTGGIFTNYGGDDELAMVHPRDIAAAAAEELVINDKTEAVRYVVSDEFTPDEAAPVLGAAIGKPDLIWNLITDAQAQAAFEKNGFPSKGAALYVELNAAIHNGLLREDYDKQKPVTMGKIKLADFVKEFAAAYNR